MIPVTKPFFPSLDEYVAQLRDVWEAGWLTNQGPKVRALEAELSTRFDAGVALVANGTLAIQLCLKALDLRGPVATTPFSFVATTSSLVWEHCDPLFVDIDPDTMNLSPAALDALDDDRVTGILATHVYGVPCDVDAIGAIAGRRGWRTVYDAAHAIGTTWRGVPVMGAGDASAASFHATKLFHTAEGGAVITRNDEILERVRRLRSFGEQRKGEFVEAGLNAKLSEVNAALGLAVLPHLDGLITRRREQHRRYRDHLEGQVRFQSVPEGCEHNCAYLPVVLESESAVLRVVDVLAAAEVEARRYFYPSLSTLRWVAKGRPTPVADDIARRVVCLPLHHTLTTADIDRICTLVERALHPTRSRP
jgi:dTDP-4-amino-4,6-dideoxygalactose transaminase